MKHHTSTVLADLVRAGFSPAVVEENDLYTLYRVVEDPDSPVRLMDDDGTLRITLNGGYWSTMFRLESAVEFLQVRVEGKRRLFALSCEFSAVLREWLSERELTLIRARNASDQRRDVCHSHDFCDANMAMEEAFHRLGYSTPFDLAPDEESPLHRAAMRRWNAAWEMARDRGFQMSVGEAEADLPEAGGEDLYVYTEPGSFAEAGTLRGLRYLWGLNKETGESLDAGVREFVEAAEAAGLTVEVWD